MNLLSKMRKIRRDDTGAAMISALLLAVVLLALMTLTAAVTVRSSQKTAETKDNVYFAQAADAAIASAVMEVNQSGNLDFFDNATKNNIRTKDFAVEGTGVVVKSSWYAKKVSESEGKEYYQLYAVGYRNSPTDPDAVTLKVRMEGLNTTGVALDPDGNTVYQGQDASAIASLGFFGKDFIKVNNPGAGFYSYDSKAPNTLNTSVPGTKVSTNGYYSAPFAPRPTPDNRLPVGSITFYDAAELTEEEAGQRCYGTTPNDLRCYTAGVATFANTYKLKDFSSEKAAACAGIAPIAWVASVNGGTLTSNTPDNNVLCLSSLYVNQNIVADARYTAANPLTVYVTGNVTVVGGRTLSPFNTTTATYAPSALQIISLGTGHVVAGAETALNSRVSAQIIAPNAKCIMGQDTGKVLFTGSLACKSIELTNETRLFSDVNAKAPENGRWTWRSTTYENVSPEQAMGLWN